ncbi:MAG: molybdopterin-dependent oxidoreductase [Candidatus Aminicenantes bacterium]|nr:molybdopterin-dependent oxidoreductase [Candidatus Aminicenantes bacterium]
MNSKDYLEIDFTDIEARFPLDRRDFLKLFGGGILVTFAAGSSLAFQEGSQRGVRPQLPTDFNAFLLVKEDGRVACFTGKIEMGQGVITSLAQMLADELEVPLESVDMVMGDTDLCPWDMGTFGSMTTRFFGPPLRSAAAEAREVLRTLASEHLQVPKNQLVVKDGVIFDKTQKDRSVSYAQLTKGKKIDRHLEEKAVLEAVSNFTVVGDSIDRLDAEDKVKGTAKYSGDIRWPDLLFARILRPPSHDAKLIKIDSSALKNRIDVQIVHEGDLFAVLHKTPDGAEEALQQVKAQFEEPESGVNDKTIFEHLLKVAPEAQIVSEEGDVQSESKRVKTMVEKTYLNSYVAHSPMEPHTATARIEGEKITVWASTQTPFSAKDEVARALGISSDNVRVITPFVGGGFGGKTVNRQAVEAALLAKLTGKPIQVAWNRKEEFFYDAFRPAAVVKIKSGISESNKIAFWDYHVYFAGQRGAQHFYAIPHSRTVVYGAGWGGGPGTHPFATGAWRAPSNNTNTFARESQIDIMASLAKKDPVEFRLNHLTDTRMQNVLNAAAEKFGWTPAVSPSKRGFGVACGIDAGTYVASIAHVEVDSNGHVQVKRVVCAQDMGLIINPEGAKNQMEGCITMGLGYALTEEIQFRGGNILNHNFDTYEIPRFSWLPKIETVFVKNEKLSPQGGGEPAIVNMGAVIANAIYDAVGIRMLQLPMTRERIKAALEG